MSADNQAENDRITCGQCDCSWTAPVASCPECGTMYEAAGAPTPEPADDTVVGSSSSHSSDAVIAAGTPATAGVQGHAPGCNGWRPPSSLGFGRFIPHRCTPGCPQAEPSPRSAGGPEWCKPCGHKVTTCLRYGDCGCPTTRADGDNPTTRPGALDDGSGPSDQSGGRP